jgi:glycosyltransferase involved in cell wall biosynthesis
MPRVLILCEYATLNGGERSMLSTLGGIAAAGFHVQVAAPAEGPLPAALQNAGIKVVPFERHDGEGRPRPLDELRSRLADILRSRPDLLHANSLAMGRLSGPVAAELSVRSLSHLRDIVSLSRQAIADLNCHGRLLAVSAATRQFHIAQGLSAENMFVVPNGVDLDQFRPRLATGYLHAELGIPDHVPLIGTIGQISLRKGQDVLAAALAQIPSQIPFAWLIVGQRFSGKQESREFEEQLHQAAAGPLAGRVHFLGMRDDVDRIVNELTLLAHPARQEPLGRVLLEAGAAGLAIVASDVGGTSEIFPPEYEAASLIPPGDVPAMAGAIARLLGDPILRQRMGQNARTRVEAAFDCSRRVEDLLSHYYRLLNETPRPTDGGM